MGPETLGALGVEGSRLSISQKWPAVCQIFTRIYSFKKNNFYGFRSLSCRSKDKNVIEMNFPPLGNFIEFLGNPVRLVTVHPQDFASSIMVIDIVIN